MTDEILSELDNRKNKGQAVTALYNELSTMQAFHVTPAAWKRLSRFDRLCLNYQRVMQQYYERKAWDEQKKKMEREEQNRKFLASLPKVRRR